MRFAKALLAACAAMGLGLALSGCTDPVVQPKADAGCDPTDPACGEELCDLDTDCGDPKLFMCVNGACIAACTTPDHCRQPHPAYSAVWPGCDGPLGCNCDERKCVPQACTDDSECGELVCISGQCVPAETAPDACAIFPDYLVMRTGQPAAFHAVAYKAGKPVSLGKDAFTWSAVGAAVENTSAKPNVFVGKTATAAGAAVEAIKATTKSGVSCTAKAMVFGDPAANQARVIVVDEMTGRPVTGAKVMYGTNAMTEDGTAKGVYTLADAAGPATVSVFHNDFGYVTLVDIAKRDLLIPVRRNSGDKVGGYKGKFTNLPSGSASIVMGIAGTSIPGSLTDLDFDVIVGPTQPTEITFSGSKFNAPLPSGVALGVGANRFKEEYRALGIAGVCAAEDKVLAGACGTRTAWSLMGEVPITAAVPLVNDFQQGVGLNVGKAVALAIPYIKDFKSGVTRDVGFDLNAGEPDFGKFVTHDHKPEVGLTLKQTVEVPELPQVGGGALDGALVLAGAQVRGRGIVPLGLSAGTDTNDQFKAANRKVIGIDVGANRTLSYHDDGKLNLRMAPNHGGIEGSQYAVVTLAIPTTGTLPGGALATSGLIQYSKTMIHGSTVKFDGGFLGFADGEYNYRTGEFKNVKLATAATIHRVVFSTEDGKRWTLYFKNGNFTVPTPPEGFADRTMADGKSRDLKVSADSARSEHTFQALKAADGATSLDMEALFEFNKTNLDNIVEYAGSFSVYAANPGVSFVEPKDCDKGCKVPGGQVFKVKVGSFEVPAKGKIELDAGEGRKAIIDALTDYAGTASFSPALPVGKHTVTARLLKSDGAPVDPVVSAKLEVTVE